jgi:hypothetical protein
MIASGFGFKTSLTGWPSGTICGYPMAKPGIFTNKFAIGLFGIIPSR